VETSQLETKYRCAVTETNLKLIRSLVLMFVSYEAELDGVLEAIRDAVEAVEQEGLSARERRTLLDKAHVDVGQAESIVRQMTVEARSDPGRGLKRKLQAKKEALKQLQQDLAAAQQKSERQDLFDARGRAAGNQGEGVEMRLSKAAQDDRERFSEVTARMERSTDTLLGARRTLAETEDVALGISENLESNRSLIIGAHERATETGGLLGGANQILRRMRERETRRKVILAGLIAFLIIAVLVILYSAVRPKNTNTIHKEGTDR